MADFLTIAGRAYPVQTTSAQENAPEYVGEKVRSFNNTQRSTREAATKKRSWTFTLGPISQASYLTLCADTDGDAVVALGGDVVGGVAVNVMTELTSVAYQRDGLSFVRVVIATLTEV